MKDWDKLREELQELQERKSVTKKRKVGAPLWAKGAAVMLAAKVNSKRNEVKRTEDPKVRDGKLADQIALSAAITTLGIAVSSDDKTLLSRVRRVVK